MNIEEFGLFEDDIQQIVKGKFGKKIQILSWELRPLEEKSGLLGEHGILKLKLKNNNEEVSFFVKSFPKHAGPAEFAEGTGAFRKENFVYQLFNLYKKSGINLIEDSIAKCYLRKPKLLIFGNLIDEGYETLNKRSYLDYETVTAVLEALAKIHAASIIFEETKGKNYRLLDEYSGDLEESFYNDKKDFINQRPVEAALREVLRETEVFDFDQKLLSGKNFQQVLQSIFEKLWILVKPSKKYRNVICHGDLWSANYLIKKGEYGHQIKIVDFQCGRYVPPAHDVMSFIYLTTSRKFRSDHMYKLLGYYYNSLEKHVNGYKFKLESIIPFKGFLQSCEEQKLFALIQSAICLPLVLVNSEDLKVYLSDPVMHEKALLEDRSYLVEAHRPNDKQYEIRLKETIHDLKNYCDYL